MQASGWASAGVTPTQVSSAVNAIVFVFMVLAF
jgi:hypothetical protein